MSETQNSVRDASTENNVFGDEDNTQKIRIKFGKNYSESMKDVAVASDSKIITNRYEKKKCILVEFVKIEGNRNDSEVPETSVKIKQT